MVHPLANYLFLLLYSMVETGGGRVWVLCKNSANERDINAGKRGRVKRKKEGKCIFSSLENKIQNR
jgi:hypothetical protein